MVNIKGRLTPEGGWGGLLFRSPFPAASPVSITPSVR